MSRTAWVSVACGAFALLAWAANLAEVGFLHPSHCTTGRMQYESALFMARALAMVLPLVALGLAAAGRSKTGAALNALALACAAGALSGALPIGHLPCLRG